MVIVDALAGAWGSFPVDGGKVVWFELDTGHHRVTARSRIAAKAAGVPRESSDLQQPFSGSAGGGSDELPSARVRVVVDRVPNR
jgi:hypothetical protein